MQLPTKMPYLVEEIGMAQTEVLNTLEVSRDRLKVTLGEISARGKSMVCLINDPSRTE